MNRKTTLLILVLCMLGLSLDMFSQGGSDCSTAVSAIPGTNIATQGIHQFFKYTPTQDEVVTLSSCNAPVNYSVIITNGCAGVVDTFMTNCSSGTKKQISFVANAGTSYILNWLSTGASPLTYSWDLSNTAVTSGQNCQNAITATLSASNHYISTTPYPIWYSYTATQDSRIEISTVGFDYPSTIKVFGSCNPDDSLESFRTNVIGSLLDHDLKYFYAKAHQTYYFRWNNPNAGQNISFDFKVEEGVLSAGETCDNPIALVNGANVTGVRYPRWYSYTPATNIEKISVTNCNGIYAQARKSCGISDFERSVKHTSCGIEFEAQVHVTYFVKLYPTSQATVTAAITAPDLGEACSNKIDAVEGTNSADHTNNTDQWYLFNPGHSGTVTLSSADANWSKIQVRFYKACDATAYLIGNNTTEVAADAPLLICLRAPAFESPVYNWTLTYTQENEGSTRTSAIPLTASGTITAPANTTDIWYKYTPAANSNVTFSSCGSTSSSTYVQIENSDGKFLGSDAGSCSFGNSSYSLLVEGGTTIYVHWTGTINQWDFTTTPTGVAIPVGYSCSSPIDITDGAQSTAYQANQRLIWYRYEAPSAGVLTVSNCANNPTVATKVYVLSGCDMIDANTVVEGTSCGTYGSGASTPLADGRIVLIAWSQLDNASGTFHWTLNFIPTASIPQGYACTDPNTAVVGHNTANTLNGDEIFTYTTPLHAGHAQISTLGLYNKAVKVSVYESCGDYLNLNSETGLNHPLVSKVFDPADSIGFDAAPGKEYLIVWSKGYTSEDFTWNLAYSALSSNAEIASFGITGQEGATSLVSGTGSIDLQMPFNTNITSLVANFTASTGSMVRVNSLVQSSGVTANDFTTSKTYAVTAQDGTIKNWTVNVTNAPNHAAEVSAFSILSHTGTITSVNATTGTIAVSVPFGTDVTTLVSTFTASVNSVVKVGTTDQVSASTANDFTSPVDYVVTAEDGTTIKTWTVSVTVLPNTAAEIESFSILGHTGTITSVNATTGTIAVSVPYGTNVTDLASTFTLSTNASVKVGTTAQVNTITKNNFTAPVNFVVTAEDGITIKTWTVTVTVLKNTAAEIVSFTIPDQEGVSTVTTGTTGTVTLKMPFGHSLTGLVPTFTLSEGASAKIGTVAQVSGTTANDFSADVTYTITSEDGLTTKDWTVTVTSAANHAATLLTFTIPTQESPAVFNTTDKTVSIVLPYNTPVTALIPTYTVSPGATVKVGSINQVSGTTVNNFSTPVVYTITADDASTTENWTVTVTLGKNHNADITGFTIPDQIGTSVIDKVKGTIDVTMPSGTDVTALVSSFTYSDGATVQIGTTDQVSGTTPNDFTDAVKYVVTAQDGTTTQEWSVIVTVAKNSGTDFLTFTVPNEVDGTTIDATAKTVKLFVQDGSTTLTALIATFTLSPGASAKVGTVDQVSGTTANDFTSDVTYIVTAEDGTSVNWTITITFNVGIDLSKVEKVNVYPNPASEVVFLNIPNTLEGKWSIQIHNVTGQVVYSDQIQLNSGKNSLDVSSLNNGVYAIVLVKGNNRFVYQMVINK